MKNKVFFETNLDYKIFLVGLVRIEKVVDKKFDKYQKELYYKLLKDINNEDFIRAIFELLKDFKIKNIPTPGEIRKYLEIAIQKREEELSFKIMEQIQKMVKDCNVEYTCDEPLTHLIVKSWGGLHKIGQLDTFEFEKKLKEIPKLIIFYKRVLQENPNKILDIPEVLGANGFYYPSAWGMPPVIYIGNETQAKEWIKVKNEQKVLLEENNKKLVELKGGK